MKKTIPVILAIIFVGGLAFYMGRQSAPAPAAENPPAESSAPEVKETPEAEPTPENEVIPEPEPTTESQNLTAPETASNDLSATFESLGIGNIELFDHNAETVYAIQNVNMRDTFSSEGNKIGVLVAGQKITRIGTGKIGEEAEGWSKAVLDDGTIVYIKSEYLSTSRVTSSSGNSNTIEAVPNKESDEKPTSNPTVNKPESTGPDPNTGNSNTQDSTNIPENPEGATQLTWEDLADGGEMEDMDGGNSDKPIDNSHLKNHG